MYKKLKHLDDLTIEEIIRLPFFYSLKKSLPDPKESQTQSYWEIQFKCNRINGAGKWLLLDHESDTEFITRYKIIAF